MKNKKNFIVLVFIAIIAVATWTGTKKSSTPQKVFVNDGWQPVFKTISGRQREWIALGINRNIRMINNPGKISVLMYHEIKGPASDISVPMENFSEQMQYLYEKAYHPISFDEYLDYKVNNKPLPVKPIIITLDDGYRDNYTNAFPILKKYGFKATIFIISGAVGRDNYLTWDMIREMYNSGLIDIGGHTINHPMLSQIPIANAETEILESKKIIENEIGGKLTFFSYPSGKYNKQVIKITQDAGYKGAVVMGSGTVDNRIDKKSELYILTRTFIGGTYSIKTFANKVE